MDVTEDLKALRLCSMELGCEIFRPENCFVKRNFENARAEAAIVQF